MLVPDRDHYLVDDPRGPLDDIEVSVGHADQTSPDTRLGSWLHSVRDRLSARATRSTRWSHRRRESSASQLLPATSSSGVRREPFDHDQRVRADPAIRHEFGELSADRRRFQLVRRIGEDNIEVPSRRPSKQLLDR